MYTQQIPTVATLYFKQTLRHLVLEDLVRLQLVLATVGSMDLFLMSVGVPSASEYCVSHPVHHHLVMK